VLNPRPVEVVPERLARFWRERNGSNGANHRFASPKNVSPRMAATARSAEAEQMHRPPGSFADRRGRAALALCGGFAADSAGDGDFRRPPENRNLDTRHPSVGVQLLRSTPYCWKHRGGRRGLIMDPYDAS